MGSKKKLAQKLERAKHANSRRTLAVIRDIKKINKREKIKGDFAAKVSFFILLFYIIVVCNLVVEFLGKLRGKEASFSIRAHRR